MFKNKLIQIQHDLSNHHTTKSTMLEKVIKERLDKALENYKEDLDKTSGYLERRDGLNVLSKYNRRHKS